MNGDAPASGLSAKPELAPTANKLFLSVNETCDRYGIGRSTFYRMLGDPELNLGEVLVRIPPGKGRLKVPVRAFEEWLRRRSH